MHTTTTFSSLPTEILCHVYRNVSTPTDYANLMQTSSFLNAIGLAPYVRNKFLEQLFVPSRRQLLKSPQPHDHWSDVTYASICTFIAASGLRPSSSDIRVAAQPIPTSHFINYPFPNATVKRAALDLFRSTTLHQRSVPIAIPALSSSPIAEAESVAYQESLPGETPRRVYYDVTLCKDAGKFAKGSHFHYVFVHVDCVVAFDDELEPHTGGIMYKDESIMSAPTWEELFNSETCEINNVPIESTPTAAVPTATTFSTTLVEDMMSPTRPAPYLLRTYTGCTLRTDIRKGGLRTGRSFAHVFVYEQEDDFLCVEFCDKKGEGEEGLVEPKGYLMFAIYDVMWQ
ncbi:hypothetical protein BC936DRAFT_148676 [Jimgerdemannia flammicorona]|uniref:F-box domain-containing protein n=1 Tax=Jimgerdemannia flammicorona TaxID=994334 RepID=A0A433D2H0_9FUNG|nr:hypothetical protein BC936DRAFT_148676 [Jimgerdemannia flammicorona]